MAATTVEQGGARELGVPALRREQPPEAVGFSSTEEVAPVEGTIGQARADEAIAFALGTATTGYNIFAAGPVGVGKRTSIEAQLRAHAAGREAPGDWVHLHNFRDPLRPIAIGLPSGEAHRLAADMRRFLEDAQRDLTTAFESDTYAHRQREVTESLEREQEAEMAQLREEAAAGSVALELTPSGVMTVPLRGKQPMTPAQFAELPEAVRARYQSAIEDLGPKVEAFLTRMRARQREARQRIRRLEREVALFAVAHLIDELKERYSDSPELVQWLSSVAEDVTENPSQFQASTREGQGLAARLLGGASGDGDPGQSRYEVNVFVAHDTNGGAPVLVEMNPTYPNLFGRIEHQGVLGGGFVTDHRMLRPGAVHLANGGYLLLPAAEVLTQPGVWSKLKEVLRTGQIRLENLADQYALLPTATLTPEPIPLDLKVVLVGSSRLYELAYELDEDVRKLFRVKAEFDWRMRWDDDAAGGYAGFLSSHARREGLRHFDAGAVARIVEHGARLVESRDWVSTQFGEIAGLAAEASHWAGDSGRDLVSAEDVERAIEHRIRRSNLIEQRLLEMVEEGTLMLDLEGSRTGQANGLAVFDLGDYQFGRPTRITATAGPGRGTPVSIDRESKRSGHIHDKGFLILSGYLRDRYGHARLLALSATLTFEQSYSAIDGDSAASAELYALLSEIAGVPLRQDIAVTGSVDQHGEIQAIGGVNEKIEGFFHACALRGLSGEQGVLIPEANVRHLMLDREVVAAVRAGRFHVWSARTVDAGIELLTGIEAGQPDEDGRFPEDSIHGRVDARLEEWSALEDSGAAPNNGTGGNGAGDRAAPRPEAQ